MTRVSRCGPTLKGESGCAEEMAVGGKDDGAVGAQLGLGEVFGCHAGPNDGCYRASILVSIERSLHVNVEGRGRRKSVAARLPRPKSQKKLRRRYLLGTSEHLLPQHFSVPFRQHGCDSDQGHAAVPARWLVSVLHAPTLLPVLTIVKVRREGLQAYLTPLRPDLARNRASRSALPRPRPS